MDDAIAASLRDRLAALDRAEERLDNGDDLSAARYAAGHGQSS